MHGTTMGLGPFLEVLEQRLDALSEEQLREILLDHATWLPAGERAGFLAVFDVPPGAPGSPTRHAAPTADAGLLAEVASFVEDIAGGVYVDGWGYDPEYRDYRAFGDESWTVELDHLLDRAGWALIARDAVTAREAYRQLLGVMLTEPDGDAGFPGAGTPDELITTDLTEARHRYLRAVWESEPSATRVAALLTAIENTTGLGGAASLAAIEATRREPLPELEAALPDLIARLAAVAGDTRFGTQARMLLAEVTERHGGVDGLAGLARTPGDQQAEAYRDWIDALVRTDRLDDARQAATEALDRLPPTGATLAAIAERAVLLAAYDADDAGVAAAQQAAWRAQSTLPRLLDVVEAATALDTLEQVMAADAALSAGRPDLAAAMLLLSGRVHDALHLAERESASAPGWDDGRHPAPIVVPFLLVGASDASREASWDDSLLLELLDETNVTGWRYESFAGDDGLDRLRAAIENTQVAAPLPRPTAPHEPLLLSALLVERLERHPPAPPDREAWLQAARRLIDGRIDAVVAAQHRSAYARVAHLAAAAAEAIHLADSPRAATGYLDDLHARYPRHSLFRRELREVAARSPVLT